MHLGLVALLWVVVVGAGLVAGLIVLWVLGAMLDSFTDWRQARARREKAFELERARREKADAWAQAEQEAKADREKWARNLVAKSTVEAAVRVAQVEADAAKVAAAGTAAAR